MSEWTREPIEELLDGKQLGWEGVEKEATGSEEAGGGPNGPAKHGGAAAAAAAGKQADAAGKEKSGEGEEAPGGSLRLAVCLCFEGGPGTIGTVKVAPPWENGGGGRPREEGGGGGAWKEACVVGG